MKINILTKLACVILLLTFGTGNGWAKHTRHYDATVTKTGEGVAYISKTDDFSEQTTIISGKSQDMNGESVSVKVGSGTLHLYAEPAPGWTFQDWTGSGISEPIVLSDPSVAITFDGRKDHGGATQLTYNATFVLDDGLIKVRTNDGGNAIISKIRNVVNDEVTITAYGEFNKIFDGWTVEGDDISDLNLDLNQPSLTFTNSGGKEVTFTANWRDAELSYYRIKDGYGNYLKMEGENGDLHITTSDAYITFEGALHLSQSNINKSPSTIFKVETASHIGTTWTSLNLYSQGLNTKSVIGGILKDAKHDGDISNELILIWNGKDGYTIKHETQDFYLQSTEDKEVFLRSAPEDAKYATWYFERVDGSTPTANLAVEAEKTIGDKSYTTLFVSFPFQCPDGMTAYYVSDVVQTSDATKWSTNGIVNVPALTPVILEWTEGSGYVVPLNTEKNQLSNVQSKAIDSDWWKGCIELYTTSDRERNTCYFDRQGTMTDAGTTFRRKVKFDDKTMRVLDVNDGKIELNTNFSQDDLPSNKCFIEYKEPMKSTANEVIFPLELDEVSPALKEQYFSAYEEVHVRRSVAGPKNGEEWGNWNTLCLPYTVAPTEIEAVFGEYELKELDHFWVTDNDGILHLRFVNAALIESGKPYMIRVKKNVADITLNKKFVNVVSANKQQLIKDGYKLDFQGSYVYLDGKNGNNYVPRDAFIINNNLFYHVASNVKMKGFRAYFWPEALYPAKSPVRSMIIAEDAPTAISSISFEGLEDGTIYNTQGVRLNSMQRGINIVNGKKIIR